ncbi:hypothetical protein KL86PLE_90356 [uncultured Pleomorphomonas sp.]|uniref:Uncharacterized protein n=1 Tax=uncultured Pleomorphomonas sp. TaxID=442121 RepID=A0A212LPA9_9HYPH|nr:hypothetical protein KL86PLE_90356 [uncultured Pleomorphomonas sp.]
MRHLKIVMYLFHIYIILSSCAKAQDDRII